MPTPSGSHSPAEPPRGASDPRPGVLLVAHGSARSGESAGPVLALAGALSDRGFPEVRAAFWKEEPFLHQALELMRSEVVLVLPVFLAEGYFTRTVVPRELGLRPGENRVGDRAVHLLSPLGAAEGMATIVAELARDGLPRETDPSSALLIVLGHGTPRDPGSADAVLAVSARLNRDRTFGRVAPAFIDQEPRLEDEVRGAREATIVVVPFLVSSGWHGGTTVPQELQRLRSVVYTQPVGNHPSIVTLAETILLRATPSRTAVPAGSSPHCLARLERALEDRLKRSEAVVLLQATCRAEQDGSFELRHVDDVARTDLAPIAGPHELSALARRRADGQHRPLRTAADLARGWRLRAPDIPELIEALLELYGPALVDWHLGESGALPTASFMETAERQTGMYAGLTQAEPPAVESGIRRTCDGIPCLRTRLWGVEDTVGGGSASEAEQRSLRLVVPCPRPCPILLSSVLDLTLDGRPAEGADRGVDDPVGLG